MRNILKAEGDNGQDRFMGEFVDDEGCVEAVGELRGQYSCVRSITSVLASGVTIPVFGSHAEVCARMSLPGKQFISVNICCR